MYFTTVLNSKLEIDNLLLFFFALFLLFCNIRNTNKYVLWSVIRNDGQASTSFFICQVLPWARYIRPTF